ncbi:MAG: response regulator [Candidatus Thiodiazotropha sp.]
MSDILVVDDQGVIRILVQEVLISMGHCVAQACSGIEAISNCRMYNYDLIILDYQMPDMNGLEVVQHLKQGTPFVLHTSDYNNKHIQLQAMRLGAMGVIAKISGVSAFQRSISPFLNQLESKQQVVY